MHKTSVLLNYHHASLDHIFGTIFGCLKGFMLFTLIIMLYGTFFLDRISPPSLTELMKTNLTNLLFQYQTDYYRYKAFKFYTSVSDAKLSNMAKTRQTINPDLGVTASSYLPVTEVHKVASYAKYSWLESNYETNSYQPSSIIHQDTLKVKSDSTLIDTSKNNRKSSKKNKKNK
jgi:hypothetical protein